MTAVQRAIVEQLYDALQRLQAPPKLLGVINSWGDTLSDDHVLEMLKAWNEHGDGALELH